MSKSSKILIAILLSAALIQNAFCFQLGDGTQNNSYDFIHVMDDVKDVFLNDNYATYCIKNDGSLWGSGRVFSFETNKFIKTDVFVKLLDDVIYFDGRYLIKGDNTLWRVCNEYGGTRENVPPSKLADNVVKVREGLFLKSDNTLWAYGNDYYGRFGTGRKQNYFASPKQILTDVIDFYASIYVEAVNTKGELLICGSHYLPAPFSKSYKFEKIAENVREISDGFYITKKDELFAFGFNGEWALGVETTEDIPPTKVMGNVKNVSATQASTFVLTNDGKVFGCGGKTPNYYGSLGLGNKEPVKKLTYVGVSDVKKIEMGELHSAIIKNDGSLWTCGANNKHAGGY